MYIFVTEGLILEYFYRFRSISSLLDGFHELVNQEIYFPMIDELNDPLEGFMDIVWRGDRIVWRNLLRHYLLCLLDTVALTSLAGDELSSEKVANLVYKTDNDLPEAPIRTIYSRACETFLNHKAVEILLDNWSRDEKVIRRDELTYYLRLMHYSALKIVIDLLAEYEIKLMSSTQGMSDHASKSMAMIPEMLRLHSSFVNEQSAALFFTSNNIIEQLSLIHELKGSFSPDRHYWLLVVQDFPCHYLKALERLLYPDWYAACFVTDPTNAAMWGHYGEGHRGMCLKFRAKPNNKGVASLELRRATSWSGNGSVGYSYVPHTFEPIKYNSEFIEIDFFRSLGRLPMIKLSHFWYRGPDGELSDIANGILGSDSQWRDEYWQRFGDWYRIKLPEWSYENEHRLILHSSIDNLEKKEDRKIKYRFDDLSGIIFGLKTSMANKIAAIRIIEEKCLAVGRTDFEFWQAYYSHRTQRIELFRLNLIRLK
uniref:DUF2971 domain-containing protein n=1 Tax=Zymomonas mobilis subsp. mobilis (strain ATCC 31821 / ZM4 / CP4) TaxID=264203 RepID=A0A806CP84_ZYMMO|nr:DUF2971 domain-containing protein [Zymomonas mobilis]ADC33923.1 conserved hypothetical protein [Zymomonas mobilis subsp. mobilis ZM4 = ATCC 31821]